MVKYNVTNKRRSGMIKTDVELPIKYTSDDIKAAISERLPVSVSEMGEVDVIKRTLVLSDKENIHYKATVALSLSEERERGLLKMKKKVAEYVIPRLDIPPSRLSSRPIVVGAGPAGLFAALLLSEAGARPIVIERGLPVEKRVESVERFFALGILDTESNIQYGEGGAGAFSDGKLKVGGMDKYKYKILSELVGAGASDEILYTSDAHLGTDRLPILIKKLREKIISLGAEFVFSAKLTKIITKDYKIAGCEVEIDGKTEFLETENLVVATGHSAKDSFEVLLSAGASLTARPFGIGVRIEHPREYINKLIYGAPSVDGLGTASYHLVTHLNNGRSAYSFCMCPGGSVVAAASEQGGIVTNGMSNEARDGGNSNAALLVSVTPEDFKDSSPLAGVELQREIERRAFVAAASSYRAPTESLSAFLGKGMSAPEVRPSYPLGTENVSLTEYLPSYITETLSLAISDFDAWLPGYAMDGAALTGPETRSTSPVRVLRSEKTLEAIGIEGLYPTGEGAGYSGGIVSSARDGLLVAEAMLTK